MAKFEDNLAALESVVERLERGDLSLEDSVKLFEDGVRLSSACKSELDAAEGKIQVLVERGRERGRNEMLATDLEIRESSAAAEDDEDQ